MKITVYYDENELIVTIPELNEQCIEDYFVGTGRDLSEYESEEIDVNRNNPAFSFRVGLRRKY